MTQQVPNALLAFDGGALGHRNLLINGAFRTNQLGYVSGTALAAGVPGSTTGYGHDGWRAGASGGTYTFTQTLGPTGIAITAGTMISACDPADVIGGAYVLAWNGTAQARVGINGAAPSGAYATSPILIPTASAGQSISVEFNTGTLDRAQLEQGVSPTQFEWLHNPMQFARCQSQLQVYGNAASALSSASYGVATSAISSSYLLPVQMRASPTVSKNGTWTVSNCAQPTIASSSASHFALQAIVSGVGGASFITSGAGQNVTLAATL